MEKLVLRKGVFYEGDANDLRAIYPTPVVSHASCALIKQVGGKEIIFREDSFDPVTRIRRGRLYVGGHRGDIWPRGRVDHGLFHPYQPYNGVTDDNNWTPDASYDAWQASNVSVKELNGQVIQIGAHDYVTPWRIVGVERIAIGHFLFTLRASSLLGVIPDLKEQITDHEGKAVNPDLIKSVNKELNALLDAFHRQEATPTVDVAREVTRTILAAWIGQSAQGKDLGKVIENIPRAQVVMNSAATIVNRLHPRGKSAERESQASRGNLLRHVTEEDAAASVHLVSMILREIKWVAS